MILNDINAQTYDMKWLSMTHDMKWSIYTIDQK